MFTTFFLVLLCSSAITFGMENHFDIRTTTNNASQTKTTIVTDRATEQLVCVRFGRRELVSPSTPFLIREKRTMQESAQILENAPRLAMLNRKVERLERKHEIREIHKGTRY